MKPGYLTTEFYLTVFVNVFGAIAASGELVPGSTWARLIGLASIALSSILYTLKRASLKQAHAENGDTEGDELDVDADAAPAAKKQGGFVRIPFAMFAVVLIGFCFLVTFAACRTLRSEGKAVASTAYDCGSHEAKELGKQLTPLVEHLFKTSVDNTGKLDKPTFAAATEHLTAIGWCTVENTAARLVSRLPLLGAPQSSPLEVDADSVNDTLASLRSERYANAKFEGVAP